MSQSTTDELLASWENAYLAQNQPARVGTLFRGTIHNLNGIVQAFSMQSELFAMMFAKSNRLLSEALANIGDDEARHKVNQVIELLDKREKTLRQVDDKVQQSQEILNNNEDLSRKGFEGASFTLQSLLGNVVTFFNSHMFFKHKVEKKTDVTASLPIASNAYELSMVLSFLLENSIAAMEAQPDETQARFAMRCFLGNDKVHIDVEDNGVGVSPDVASIIFEPFISTSAGHAGLGLYFARKLMDKMAGSIEVVNSAMPTVFRVTLPVDQVR